jgi:hypothetical protein
MSDLISWEKVGAWLLETGVTLIATGIAAFVGVDWAFRREREKRAEDVADGQAAQLRRALFALTRAHGFLDVVKRDFCDVVRNDPLYAVIMKPFVHTDIDRYLVNPDALNFLLGTEHREAVVSVVRREESLLLLQALMRKRSELVTQTIQPAVAQCSVQVSANESRISLHDLEQLVGAHKVFEAKNLSEQIVELVDLEIRETPLVQKQLRAAGGKMFPKKNLSYLAAVETSRPDPAEPSSS